MKGANPIESNLGAELRAEMHQLVDELGPALATVINETDKRIALPPDAESALQKMLGTVGRAPAHLPESSPTPDTGRLRGLGGNGCRKGAGDTGALLE